MAQGSTFYNKEQIKNKLQNRSKKKTRKQRFYAICEYPKADARLNIDETFFIGNAFGVIIYL